MSEIQTRSDESAWQCFLLELAQIERQMRANNRMGSGEQARTAYPRQSCGSGADSYWLDWRQLGF